MNSRFVKNFRKIYGILTHLYKCVYILWVYNSLAIFRNNYIRRSKFLTP
uniref:Uncharacterized protein n=1 Tax=Podoviridae sp. ctG4L18 TaxID=2825234 RepID=A0A8S5UP81_9CAUD|nr:MAG TPA: hypothetical protein [Podoviridae sp. ctG4L18]